MSTNLGCGDNQVHHHEHPTLHQVLDAALTLQFANFMYHAAGPKEVPSVHGFFEKPVTSEMLHASLRVGAIARDNTRACVQGRFNT